MKPLRTAALAALMLAGGLTAADPKGPFEPNWESVRAHYQYPEWFRDAKFGIFLHWGLYSVPARGSEWYVQHMYNDAATIQWHLEHFGPLDKFGYKDFIPLFTAANFTPSWPGEKAVVPSLGSGQSLKGKIGKVELLGRQGDLKFTQDAQGLTVAMPAEQPCQYAFALKITGLKLKE